MAYTIVGLGNPGGEYTNTKHNVGRMVVDFIADANDIEMKEHKASSAEKGVGIVVGEKATLLNPNTFMNKSGSAVSKIVKSIPAAKKMIVIYDDLDMPLGKIKISFGGGSGGHKGVESIARGIKTKDFIRVRVGISSVTAKGVVKKPKGEERVIKHLMSDFGKDVAAWNTVKKKAREAVELILAKGHVIAQNEVNSWR